jgi:cutinase
VYELPKGKSPVGATAGGEKCIRDTIQKLGFDPQPLQSGQLLGSTSGGGASTSSLGKGSKGRVSKGKIGFNRKEVFEMVSSGNVDNLMNGFDMTLEKRQGGCKPHTMIYARGTFEAGEFGMTVGPQLKGGLGNDWATIGVKSSDGYYADYAGDMCVGLPGGAACKKVVDALGARCPNTKIVLSGYSQGAMVARICAAYANDSVKAQIKVRSPFGTI